MKLKTFKPVLTVAAVWEPINSFIQFDNIFPHIAYGFRNRTIPIAIYHVNLMFEDLRNLRFLSNGFVFRILLGKLSTTMMPVK